MSNDVAAAYDQWSHSYDRVANPTRDLDARVIRQLLAGQRHARVLELGCGTGKNTDFLAGLTQELFAVDFSPGMLEQARHKVRASHVRFVAADLCQPWPFEAGHFDLMSCNLVLEHVQDLAPVFAQAARCLAPGGRFVLAELHPLKQYLGSQARFVHGDGEVRIPAHVHHVSDFLRDAGAAGLRLVRLDEWWDGEDRSLPPRLLSLIFTR